MKILFLALGLATLGSAVRHHKWFSNNIGAACVDSDDCHGIGVECCYQRDRNKFCKKARQCREENGIVLSSSLSTGDPGYQG